MKNIILKRYYLIIPITMFLFSCNKDIKDVTIQGIVSNSEHTPFDNVKVTIICWKYGNSPDDSYAEQEVKEVFTDCNGKYFANFDKAAFVEVKIIIDGYIAGHEATEIYRKQNVINVCLTPLNVVW